MKPTPQQHSFRLNHLGIGDIQLGKRPSGLPCLLPFDTAPLYHVFDGDLKCTIESRDTGIVLRHLFVSTNDCGFINRIFLYPEQVNHHLSERLSQLYGEPDTGQYSVDGKLAGMQECWVTEGETEVSLFTPVYNSTLTTVICFRFFYDVSCAKDDMITPVL